MSKAGEVRQADNARRQNQVSLVLLASFVSLLTRQRRTRGRKGLSLMKDGREGEGRKEDGKEGLTRSEEEWTTKELERKK